MSHEREIEEESQRQAMLGYLREITSYRVGQRKPAGYHPDIAIRALAEVALDLSTRLDALESDPSVRRSS